MAAVYKTYDDEVLRHIQRVELDMLKEFDSFCTANKINYFCLAGTALGVVRHKGFIPWDDDIDIGLVREDYDRFLHLASMQLSEKYDFLNNENDPSYPLMTTRMVLKGTTFREECFKNLPCNFGIFLDLYCLDYVPDNEARMKLEAITVWLEGKLMILSAIDDPVLYVDGFAGRVIRSCCRITHRLFQLFGITPDVFYRSIMKKLKRNSAGSSRVSFQFETKMFISMFYVDDLFPVQRLPFEELEINCPANITKCVESNYGPDYMTLPPPDKRHNHPPYALDFGKY